jgi:hypothetical protein
MDKAFRRQIIGALKAGEGKSPSMLPGNSSMRYTEWMARTLGYVDTTMAYTVYGRYIPNLTRQDGSAFDPSSKPGLPTMALKECL